MCNYFSCIATRTGALLFTEDNSHGTIISRAYLRDDNPFMRWFVRLEIRPPFTEVTVDEKGSLPAWFEEDKQLIFDRAIALAKRIDHQITRPLKRVWDDADQTLYRRLRDRDERHTRLLELNTYREQSDERYIERDRLIHQAFYSVGVQIREQHDAAEAAIEQSRIELMHRIPGYVPEYLEVYHV